MVRRKLICAALSVLLMWNAGVGLAEEESLILIEEGEDSICAAAVELGMAPLAREEETTGAGEILSGEEAPSLSWFEEKGLTLGESVLAYPALREGLAEEALREEINERILEDGGIRDYGTRISQLISGGRLQVSWRGTVLGPVFSFAMAAQGAVSSLRDTFVWTGGNIDLRDGHEVTLSEIFSEEDAALARMEAYLEEEVAPELSAHLLNSALTPLPSRFTLSERGIIFAYPIDQLSTLSDRAGDVLIPWHVVREDLDTSAEGIFAAMGLLDWLPVEEYEVTADSGRPSVLRERLLAMAAEGIIPGIPARLGDSIQSLTDAWRMLIDPDVYALGRFFSLEGAAFRDVFLMTDYLSESWESSTVDGIRVDVGSVYGLTIGVTTRETWQSILGAPDYVVEYDDETAEAYRTVPGTRDYYALGDHRLQLHGDADGMLVSVILSE